MPRIYDVLCADHHDLDHIFDRLLNEVRANDTPAADQTWSEFERELRNHMDAEETFVLPQLDQTAPNDAAHIRGEHDKIRAILTEMGLSLQLHLVHDEKVASFLELLRNHAKHEETSLYPFADRFLAEEAKKSLFLRIRQNILNAALEWQGP